MLCVPEGTALSRNCQLKLRRKDCRGRHHVCVCDTFPQPYHLPNREQEEGLGRGHHTSTLYIDARTSLLLQTAQAMVSGTGHDEKSVKAKVISDSCSQRSYVSCRLKESLNLPVFCTD